MIYPSVREGVFLARPNRFIAQVELGGKTEICHVKNTGRCKELLIPGAEVFLSEADKPGRSTKYDLVAVRKAERLINMDSQAPNKVFLEHLRSGRYMQEVDHIKPEAKYGGSRFDFYVEAGERKVFIEVKGVTLEEGGVALFPDAPTLRGVKHLNELAGCVREGYEAHVVFVIQMAGALYFAPNDATHPAFGEALAAAMASGVKATALDCFVAPDRLEIKGSVPVHIRR
ncbi:MAG: DNA/RNA nuclease SfsA [Clostridiales bacterium]|nr:DNA/RNA nuclease SfsA [Clostridiales bacterium]